MCPVRMSAMSRAARKSTRACTHKRAERGMSAFGGRIGNFVLIASLTGFDPYVWSGRAVQEVSSSWRSAVLHQCIRSLIGAVLLRTNMDISARAISLTDRPQRGHVGHQCSHAPGRPILHRRLILSQTSAGKGIDYVTDGLLAVRCSFVRAWRPFLRPDLRGQRCAARRDRQGWPSRLPCRSRQRCQATP